MVRIPKVFLDSNVIISRIFDEFGGKYEFMSYRVEEFFRKVSECHYTVVLSDAIIDEISRTTDLSKGHVMSFLSNLEEKVLFVSVVDEDIKLATTLRKKGASHFADLKHLATAIRSADIMCTWNIKDFIEFSDLMPVLSPDML